MAGVPAGQAELGRQGSPALAGVQPRRDRHRAGRVPGLAGYPVQVRGQVGSGPGQDRGQALACPGRYDVVDQEAPPSRALGRCRDAGGAQQSRAGGCGDG